MRLKAVIRTNTRRSKADIQKGLFEVYIRIQKINNAFISTNIRVKQNQFDRKYGLIINHRSSQLYNVEIEKIMDAVEAVYFENRALQATDLKKMYLKTQEEQSIKEKNMSFQAFADSYISLKIGRDQAALMSFQVLVKKFDSSIRLDDWSIQKTDQFTSFLRVQPGRKPGSTFSENTVIKKLDYLKRILNYAEINDYIDSSQNPFKKGYKIKAMTSRDTKLDLKQMHAMKEEFGDNQYVRAFLLAYYLCGMRFSDIARLRWDNFDFERSRMRYKMQKTNKKLELPLTKSIIELLDIIRKDYQSSDGYVFPWLDGKDPKEPRSSDGVNARANKFFKKVGKKIGEPNLTFHVSRNTFAYLANPIVGEKGAQQLLNHSSLDQTSAYIGTLKDSDLNHKIQSLHDLF